MTRFKALAGALTAAVAALALMVAASSASAIANPSSDPFYSYTGSTPLAAIAPGTVLKSRVVSFHVYGVGLPLRTTQLLYRSRGALGQPTVNATSVIEPGLNWLFGSNRVVSYQSAYDSLSTNDQPSHIIAGGHSAGDGLTNMEAALYGPMLLAGYTVVISDTEGQGAHFAAGPEYGYNTLDSLRAAIGTNKVAIAGNARVALMGYSGGAIATEWASELAPGYSPDLKKNLIGAAFGGVLVNPARNLHYVDGAGKWAGVMPMAIVGIARSYGIDLSPYLNAQGMQAFTNLQDAAIDAAQSMYTGIKWTDLAKPEYATPESIPAYVNVANKLIMSTGGTPTIPLMIGQGADGTSEGTPNDKPGIGAGDGVMIAGDVRALAREYCRRGVNVNYSQYEGLAHSSSIALWAPSAIAWVIARMNYVPSLPNCGSIAGGGSLAPIPTP